jgi:phosphate transport system permease protein
MMPQRHLRRRVKDYTMRSLLIVCVIIALIPLVSIVYTAAANGAQVMSIHFLTSPEPTFYCTEKVTGNCSYGGIAPAIEGSFAMLALASLISIPGGILAGIYLAEFSRGPFGRAVSFVADVMSGFPSIVLGVFVYVLVLAVVGPASVYSAAAGSLALGIIMLPIVTRTTEEGLRLVPQTLREAGYALGIPRYRTTLRVVLRGASGSVVTGAILAFSRAGSEAAPLLLTAFGNRLGFVGYNHPSEALPPIIYNWGTSGFGNLTTDAWGAALFLILIMLPINLGARMILYRQAKRQGTA